jgi:hypothetical protein
MWASPPSLTGICKKLHVASRYGDTYDGKTTTLCVRRATYWDPELGREDPAKKGICSNFLCDAEPGTEITMTGLQRNPGSHALNCLLQSSHRQYT